MPDIIIPKLRKFRVNHEGNRVLILEEGKLILDVSPDIAMNLSRFLRKHAALAKEYEIPEQIIEDQAILMRKGAPIGLSDNPDIQKEARKEASWSRKLRRFIPFAKFGAIQSRERFGIPTIIKKPPTNERS